MKKLLSVAAAALFVLPLQAHAGGVAVLDIDAVARDLGVEEQVRIELLTLQNNLNAELQRTQTSLQNQMAGVEQAVGPAPTEEQRQQILVTNQQLNAEFNRLRGQAEQTLAQERVRLINEFRIRLEPIAREAAQAKGLDVILMKVTPPVFTYTPEADITEETVQLAREAGMQVEAGAAPDPVEAPATLSEPVVPAPTEPAEPAEEGSKGKGKGQESPE